MSQMTVTDLAMMARIIDTATQRGAFRAGELKQVGELYERLTAFLNEVQKAAKAKEEEGAPAAPTEGAPADSVQGG